MTYVYVGGTTDDRRYDYDARRNLDSLYVGNTLVYAYTFDVENQLASVKTNNQTTTFAYDVDGQRLLTSRTARSSTPPSLTTKRKWGQVGR